MARTIIQKPVLLQREDAAEVVDLERAVDVGHDGEGPPMLHSNLSIRRAI
jgi:hypothetical protein